MTIYNLWKRATFLTLALLVLSMTVSQAANVAYTTANPLSNATANGNGFISGNVTGVTTQAGASATTPALTLSNQKGSGIDLVVWQAGWMHTVAPGAASVVWLGINNDPNAAVVTGTLTATKIANSNVAVTSTGTGQCLLAATLPAAPTTLIPLGCMLTGAITTQPSQDMHWTYFNGGLRIHPGGAISFQTSTASGASGFWGAFMWTEEPTTIN